MMTLLAVIGGFVSIVVGYATWLGDKEAPHERRERIRSVLEEKEFSSRGITFQVDRVMFSENESYSYKIRKLIPFVRRLEGKTIVKLQSDGEKIEIRTDGLGPTEYLNNTLKTNDRLRAGHPDFRCDRDHGDRNIARLEISSWEETPILRLMEEIPVYLHESLYTYPDSSEYDIEKDD